MSEFKPIRTFSKQVHLPGTRSVWRTPLFYIRTSRPFALNNPAHTPAPSQNPPNSQPPPSPRFPTRYPKRLPLPEGRIRLRTHLQLTTPRTQAFRSGAYKPASHIHPPSAPCRQNHRMAFLSPRKALAGSGTTATLVLKCTKIAEQRAQGAWCCDVKITVSKSGRGRG